jgi:penicillin-binding protein 2
MNKKFTKIRKMSKGLEIEDAFFTATQQEAAKIEIPLDKKWLNFLWWMVLLSLLILGGRVFYLVVIKGNYYQQIAKNNRIRPIILKAPRGKIYDRFGKVMVNNIPSMDAIIIPADLPREAGARKNLASAISKILGLNEGDVQGIMESLDLRSLSPVLLRENLSQEESLVMAEASDKLPGIKVEKTAIRDYINGPIFSHVLGYEGKIKKEELNSNPDYLMTDYIGKEGIEKSYEKYLRGSYGAIQVEVDSLGNIKKELGTKEPQSGSDLTLSIDAELQNKIYDSLNNILNATGTRTAAAVAINPQNGEVLASVSLPSYDNNLFTGGMTSEKYSELINDSDSPLFDRAISGEYPPGSTLKPLIAIAALSERTINEGTTVDCNGGINIGSYHFGDWKIHGGGVDVKRAIAESCDVFFYSAGGGYNNIEGLGMNRMKKYENLFGLGEKTGIDVPGEADGLIPDEQWKIDKVGEKWYIGDSYHAAIGQGYLTITPLQLTNYISAIANGGTLYKPRIVSQIKKIDGKVINRSTEIIRDNFISPDIIKAVKEGMRATITSGSAQLLNGLPVAVAGKTGTAQFGSENKTHAWFVSFAPYDNPQIAMAILVEGGGEGSSSAVPVTKEIYDWYFSRNL